MNEKAQLSATSGYIGVLPSHLPNRRAVLADQYLRAMLESSNNTTFAVAPEDFGRVIDKVVALTCSLAEAMEREWERRGWMLEVPPK